MTDIVELLRGEPHRVPSGLALEAADEIEMLRRVENDAAEWVDEKTKRLRAEIERLRRHVSLLQGHDTLAQFEAHIAEQEETIERLRAALQPFAVASDSYDDEPPARVIASKRGSILSVYDLRAAKAALE